MIPLFFILLGVCLAAELLSLRNPLKGIEYDLTLSKAVAEQGEEVELCTAITNRALRVVPFLRLAEDVPEGMDAGMELELLSATHRRCALRSSVYLMPRQRLRRVTPVTFRRRGRMVFLGADLSGGDFLGFSEKGGHVSLEREIVILPKPLLPEAARALPGGLTGEKSVQRFIFEDPMLNLGYREYTGREPMKQLAWAQTARLGRLMVKNPDHTTEKRATVLLNLDTFAFDAYGEELIEKSLSLARGVCEALEDMRVPYSFLTNARLAGTAASGEAGDGLGKAHIRPVLEGLGRATYERGDTAWSLVDRAARRCEAGRCHILITPMPNDLRQAGLERLEMTSGAPVRVLAAMEVCP